MTETASKAKAAGVIGGLVALLGATAGVYTAVHGTHTTTTAISRNDTPVVVNRPHDANGSPLPVSIIQPSNGPPIVIVGHGAPTPCISPSPTPTSLVTPKPTPTGDDSC